VAALDSIIFGKPRDLSRRIALGFLSSQPVQRLSARDLLPAAPIATPALRTVRLDDEVADLGGETVRSAVDLPIGQEGSPDAGAHRHEEHMLVAASGTEAHLGPAGGVRVVVHDARKAAALLDEVPDGDVSEREVRRESHRPGLEVHHPGDADPHGSRITRGERGRQPNDFVQDRRRVLGRG
jgi:hypothetical protein